jgi:hypothetical protein
MHTGFNRKICREESTGEIMRGWEFDSEMDLVKIF